MTIAGDNRRRPTNFGFYEEGARVSIGFGNCARGIDFGVSGRFPPRNGEDGAKRRVGYSRQGFTPSDSACGRATFPVSGKDQRHCLR